MYLHPITFLLSALGGVGLLFSGLWAKDLVRLRRQEPADAALKLEAPRPPEILTGAGAMFLDTLGIGSFAISTAALRAQRLLPDHLIPGTLNAGHSLASILQVFIYLRLIPVDATTLLLCVAASTLGAWLGAGVVAGWPRRRVQAGMGIALLVAACLMLPGQLHWKAAAGEALGLGGWKLAVAVGGHLGLGALMTLGIGLFAPSMILLSLLGMSPKPIFPIMMAACAFLMPVGGMRFIQARSYSPRVALGLTLGGLPAVLVAAFLVKEIPLYALRWIVLGVVVYTGAMLLRASREADKALEPEPECG